MVYLLIKIFGRECIFRKLFTKQEHTAIINALWRRSEDDSLTLGIEKENEVLKETCKKLAMEL